MPLLFRPLRVLHSLGVSDVPAAPPLAAGCCYCRRCVSVFLVFSKFHHCVFSFFKFINSTIHTVIELRLVQSVISVFWRREIDDYSCSPVLEVFELHVIRLINISQSLISVCWNLEFESCLLEPWLFQLLVCIFPVFLFATHIYKLILGPNIRYKTFNIVWFLYAARKCREL